MNSWTSLPRTAPSAARMRFHVALGADRGGNVELFMQAGFAGRRRGVGDAAPGRPGSDLPWSGDEAARRLGIRPAQPLDALALSRLYACGRDRAVGRVRASSGSSPTEVGVVMRFGKWICE